MDEAEGVRELLPGETKRKAGVYQGRLVGLLLPGGGENTTGSAVFERESMVETIAKVE